MLAAPASAAVMPGTTSTSIPASLRELNSSSARPNNIGSPPLRRTTTGYFFAASTKRLLIKCCAEESLPQRLPTGTRVACGLSASISGSTKAS